MNLTQNFAFASTDVIIPIVVGIIALIVGAWLGYFIIQIIDKRFIESNRNKSLKLVEDAYETAKTIKKEAIIDAKEEAQKIRNEVDIEIKNRRIEIQKNENRLNQREEYIDKKELSIDKKNEQVELEKQKIQSLKEKYDKTIQEEENIKNQMIEKLEKISFISKEQAKKMLIDSMLEEAKIDASKQIKEIEEETKNEANKKARSIIAEAIQKCATDVTSETTISTVTIPNEEMKGRIIGREGRNIRSIESAMGVDLIVDDTPEIITISCFDPVRREIARLSLEKLIMDGRIHPAKIEEIVNKVTKDVEQTIKEAGEESAEEAGVFNLHPELVKLLGKLKYRTSYGQNCLKHSLETSYLAGLLASELGADIKIAKRGGLLHDIGKALDHDMEGTHTELGVEYAKRYKESPEVIHCIEAHHGEVEFQSVEAILVQVADAISSSRPGARRETLENYIKRLSQLEEIANSFTGVEKSYAIQAGREIRIIVKPSVINDQKTVFLAKDIAKKIEAELSYPGQIKVNVIREVRVVETAK